jgi:hypothetical protein
MATVRNGSIADGQLKILTGNCRPEAVIQETDAMIPFNSLLAFPKPNNEESPVPLIFKDKFVDYINMRELSKFYGLGTFERQLSSFNIYSALAKEMLIWQFIHGSIRCKQLCRGGSTWTPRSLLVPLQKGARQ